MCLLLVHAFYDNYPTLCKILCFIGLVANETCVEIIVRVDIWESQRYHFRDLDAILRCMAFLFTHAGNQAFYTCSEYIVLNFQVLQQQ